MNWHADITARQRPLAVNRLPHGVDHPPEPFPCRVDHWLCLANFGAAANTNAFDGTERHHQGAIITEANNLTGKMTAATGVNGTAISDGQRPLNAADFNQHPENSRNPAEQMPVGQLVYITDKAFDQRTAQIHYPSSLDPSALYGQQG